MTDKTALSYWFPKIEAAGLPVPRTMILKMPQAAQMSIWEAFDQKELTGAERPFFAELGEAARALGLPCFLRTDHTSGKHEWDRTCFVRDADSIGKNAMAIAYFSECMGAGLPWDTWVVRELLPTMPYATCPRYDNMPVCREFRFFVEDGTVRCWHPYWPMLSLWRGEADPYMDYEGLCEMPNEAELRALASAAGNAVGGAWSVDLLETKRGWFIADMAEANKSYHWEGCDAGPVDMVAAAVAQERARCVRVVNHARHSGESDLRSVRSMIESGEEPADE